MTSLGELEQELMEAVVAWAASRSYWDDKDTEEKLLALTSKAMKFYLTCAGFSVSDQDARELVRRNVHMDMLQGVEPRVRQLLEARAVLPWGK